MPGPLALVAGGLLLGASVAVAAEPVKQLLPKHYQARVVAPRQGRALLVNFWATWCEPCREELPALVAASQQFKSRDVAVVLVSLDSYKTGRTAVPAFLEKQRIPFVCWLLKAHDAQPFIELVDKSWDGALPYSVLYDRKGKLVGRLSGKQTQSSFIEAIKKALS